MKPLTRWYRKISRYSTPILAVVAFALSAYVWLNRPQVYFESYCEAPADIDFKQRYDSSYECDRAVIEYLQQPQQACIKAGCRRIEKL